jgi:hypothetical protein
MAIGTPILPSTLGAVIVAEASNTVLNITAKTLVKASGGRAMRVSVVVAGSAVGAVYDQTSLTVDTTKTIFSIPAALGNYVINFPCKTGILVVPPTGGTVAVSFC